MHRFPYFVCASALFGVAVLGACTTTPTSPEPSGDASSADAQPEAEGGTPAPMPEPTRLPVGRDAVMTVSEGGAIDIMSAAWIGRGPAAVVWDRSDEAFTRSTLQARSWSTRAGEGWSSLTPLDFGSASLTASPSIVTLPEGTFLYAATAGSLQSKPVVRRAPFTVEASGAITLGAPAALPAIPSVDWLLSWPTFVVLADGRVACTFRDGAAKVHVAFSDDGRSFGASPALEVGAMMSLAQAKSGLLALTYQTEGALGGMVAWVRTDPSARGETWSAPVRLTTTSENVHDTHAVLRADGGLDLYYIQVVDDHGFSLFRRALDASGNLGTEQRVTDPSAGEPSKPSPSRLAEGGVLLTYAEITKRAAGGAPSEQILRALVIHGDAPR